MDAERRRRGTGERGLALAQGAYFGVTGVWPLVHEASFEAVTGPKLERWLVKTVGVLIAAIGATLALAGGRGRVTPEVRLLAAGSAAGLGAIDAIYAGRGRIAPVYLGDAAIEAALVAAWAVASARAARAGRRARADAAEAGR
jgi:hypothetical protein